MFALVAIGRGTKALILNIYTYQKALQQCYPRASDSQFDLALTDAPAFQDGARQGACARFTLPIARPKTASAPGESTEVEPSERPETVSEEAAL